MNHATNPGSSEQPFAFGGVDSPGNQEAPTMGNSVLINMILHEIKSRVQQTGEIRATRSYGGGGGSKRQR